jgi:hypothetical protein
VEQNPSAQDQKVWLISAYVVSVLAGLLLLATLVMIRRIMVRTEPCFPLRVPRWKAEKNITCETFVGDLWKGAMFMCHCLFIFLSNRTCLRAPPPLPWEHSACCDRVCFQIAQLLKYNEPLLAEDGVTDGPSLAKGKSHYQKARPLGKGKDILERDTPTLQQARHSCKMHVSLGHGNLAKGTSSSSDAPTAIVDPQQARRHVDFDA